MGRIFFFLLLLFFPAIAFAQSADTVKTYTTVKVTTAPVIDGKMDEEVWKSAPLMNDFFQYLPLEGTKPDHPTDVRIIYDNNAIYIGAIMYDSSPDSILKELGARDAEVINADYIRIGIDPYNNRQDCYFFGVYASGVQFDQKYSDFTFDAVWESATSITDKGWIAEIKIPYSAIRFPKNKDQKWALQVNRSVRRTREFTQWSKTPSATNNPLIYWGNLVGLHDIELPLRLSFTPYFSSYAERSPIIDSEGKTTYSNSLSYNVGADIKYGIDERFTLDMILFPDFGQVQSDNKIKSLSYREVTYDENRAFFKESTELFNKDKLFYSRRIGKIPAGFFSAEDNLQPGESVTENPSKVKLLNATKLSGRTDHGLGIGVLNAVTDNTYAVIEDQKGNKRKVLTEPLTNFNVVVFDQQLKNNSNFYLINTNVVRDKGYSDANVTGSGFSFSNKKNTFSVDGSVDVSQRFTKDEASPTRNFNDVIGYRYFIGARKLGGLFEYGASREVLDNNYYTSDLGYQSINTNENYSVYVNHNLRNPWKIFRNSYNNAGVNYAQNFLTGKTINNEFYLNLFATFLDYNSVFAGGGFTPWNFYDYYEPRVEGRFNKGIKYFYTYTGFSTDYRKKLAVDLNLNLSNFITHFVSEGYNTSITLRYRVSDKFNLKGIAEYNFDPYNYGFVDIDQNDQIIYGLRILNTYQNSLNAQYIFKNDMYISLNVRHYWLTAKYRKYVTILESGDYVNNNEYSVNNDFSYNAFNIDLAYSWQFSPGSNITIVYKNAIESDEVGIPRLPKFDKNFNNLMNDPQTNSLSVKVLYYLDYQYIKKKLHHT